MTGVLFTTFLGGGSMGQSPEATDPWLVHVNPAEFGVFFILIYDPWMSLALTSTLRTDTHCLFIIIRRNRTQFT